MNAVDGRRLGAGSTCAIGWLGTLGIGWVDWSAGQTFTVAGRPWVRVTR